MKKGWETKKLGDVCEMIKRGIAPKYIDDDTSLTVINQKCIRNHNVNLAKARKHNEKIKSVNPERIVQLGDVLVNSTGTGTLGRVAQIRNSNFPKCTVDTHVTIVRPIKGLFEIDFFGYVMISIENEIKEAGEGTSGQTELRRTKLSDEFYVSYPKSLPEQKQIVTLLESAFSNIDQAKANLEQNIANAKELFQSKLNEIFSQKGDGWEEKSLGEVCYLKSGGTPSRSKKEYWNEGTIPWYSSGELNHTFTNAPERHITQLGLENSNAKLFPKGSLLIGMYDTAALKMSIIDRDATFNQAIVGVEPKDNIDLIFIMHSINYQRQYILSLRRGVRQKNLNQSKIKAIKIHLPELSIQNEIVNELKVLKEKLQIVLCNFDTKLQNLEDLKKSLLQKAFAGELTMSELGWGGLADDGIQGAHPKILKS